jgi:hypothetical protein
MIKNYLTILCAIVLAISLQGCDAMLVAMDQTTQSYGGVCEVYHCDVKMYNSETGEYDYEGNMIKDNDGNDISYNEESWIRRKMDEYLYASSLNLYYATSPYSDVSYQFKVTCAQWQQQQQSSYGY